MHSQANAYALRATYGFLVRKTWIASLGDASRAYKLDKEVYALDPKNIDALMLVGGYDYIVGYLPWHMRTLGFIAGFRGDKDRGLKTMERVAREGNASKRDMQFTLCALYRREGQAAKAIPMIQELIAAYPRNYLLRFELAQMYGAVGEREKALAVLADVARRKQTNVPGYARVTQEKIDYETGNLQFWFNDFDRALESLRKVTSSPALKNDLDLNTGALAFMRQGQIYDLTNRHALAIPLYRSAIQYAPEAEAAKESQRYLNTPYKRSAKS
jgi:tetratricopeptide (TPR) repeat protein